MSEAGVAEDVRMQRLGHATPEDGAALRRELRKAVDRDAVERFRRALG
jgi:hypothetical protein